MLEIIIKRFTELLSLPISIIAVLSAYYVGFEKNRSWQGFLLGMALWMIALSFTLLSPELRCFKKISKSSIIKRGIYLFHFIALSWILPLGILLPFFGAFSWKHGILLNFIGFYEWINYSLLFTGLFVTVFIINLLFVFLRTKKKS